MNESQPFKSFSFFFFFFFIESKWLRVTESHDPDPSMNLLHSPPFLFQEFLLSVFDW
ncbi:hypothetical protein ES319_A05G238200v1 [Gossypium barbadense]|uniref:Uncharacterized protein n=3 Tax=Gossypium TaxID=3633 RepID=A0A5J5VS85_GOSBA|nr:hypothetical protein ES319_A05G238200v1 [Gossypium barbadense]TYH18120.1 hypothetical protein ES288_A05G244200v1 [Gossypium darwinii]TYI28490.1 hypothetical protein ES332_A05G248300v1 [Gossypium tomentosum]